MLLLNHISRCIHSSDNVLHDFREEKSDTFGVVIRAELKQHGTRELVKLVLRIFQSHSLQSLDTGSPAFH
ncbi:hypothetical protein QTP88_024380 [Uroleucon formosanum]